MARTEALHSATYELSYASINWIRFEGSPCHAFSRATSMASQPPQRGSPSFIGENRLQRFSRTSTSLPAAKSVVFAACVSRRYARAQISCNAPSGSSAPQPRDFFSVARSACIRL